MANGVLAYTYDAAMHCPGCAGKRFGPCGYHDTGIGTGPALSGMVLECCGAWDSEGNEAHPVFTTDERNPDGESCDDCLTWIYPPFCGDCGRDFEPNDEGRYVKDCDCGTDDE